MTSRKPAPLLAAHAGMVTALALVLLVTEAMQPAVADANIGGGAAWLGLSLLGLPLSLLGFTDLTWAARIAVAIVSACVNVGLHWWLRRRKAAVAQSD